MGALSGINARIVLDQWTRHNLDNQGLTKYSIAISKRDEYNGNKSYAWTLARSWDIGNLEFLKWTDIVVIDRENGLLAKAGLGDNSSENNQRIQQQKYCKMATYVLA